MPARWPVTHQPHPRPDPRGSRRVHRARVAFGGALFVSVKIALVVICGWAATIGGTTPLLAKRLRIDPAVVSTPMVTTLVDATGLIIYFMTAKAVLGI
ncbi:magnesium transporter [Streptomyces sp. NPDC058268]|uniref:magnesium transporter n=1 Tax=Streptomyces sp. NPDC058268 TaxID=3346413 RepID=UPI0036EF436A